MKIDKLIKIDKTSKCLNFLSKRIISNKYRGHHLSQHNRLTENKIKVILEGIEKISGMNFLEIRTKDLKKEPNSIWIEYKNLINYINNSKIIEPNIGSIKGRLITLTEDSLRKNLFVDLKKMGLIERYDKSRNKEKEPKSAKKFSTKYIKISENGIKFINLKNEYEQKCMLNELILVELLGSFYEEVINIMFILFENSENNKISIYEFMYFVTFVNFKLEGKTYDYKVVAELILDFKNIPKIQKEAINEKIIKISYDTLKNKKNNKSAKIDFNNWKNQSQQIFTILGTYSKFFESHNNELFFKIKKEGSIFSEESSIKRSYTEKIKYFKKHKITKKSDFDLHHIYPLHRSENTNQYNEIDSWENMVYIDTRTHAIITREKSSCVILDFDNNNNITLSSFLGGYINLEFGQNCNYDPYWQKTMKAKNNSLRNLK